MDGTKQSKWGVEEVISTMKFRQVWVPKKQTHTKHTHKIKQKHNNDESFKLGVGKKQPKELGRG